MNTCRLCDVRIGCEVARFAMEWNDQFRLNRRVKISKF